MLFSWPLVLLADILRIAVALESPRSLAMKPTETDCSSGGSLYVKCGEGGCHNPSAGETCCCDGTVYSNGAFCIGGGYCCPTDASLVSCMLCCVHKTTIVSTVAITTVNLSNYSNGFYTSALNATVAPTTAAVTTYGYFSPTAGPNIPTNSTSVTSFHISPPISSATRATNASRKTFTLWPAFGAVLAACLWLNMVGAK